MSYEDQDHTAEVAEDYQLALEDLTMNSKVEIANLTQIARENTDYAEAIAQVLQEHIKKVAPQRKLPALYVLDSIAKNVGTPYNLYFGRNLYSTFMEAYASVDNNVRRKMDEMLRTWKEPVPGSIDTRPVFSPDFVRPIENALIKLRTSTLQAQQEQMRNQQQLLGRGRPPPPYRDTPTPPGFRSGSQQPGPYAQPPYPPVNGTPRPDSALGQLPYAPPAVQLHPRPTPPPVAATPATVPYQAPGFGAYGAPPPQPGISIDALNEDVRQLIAASKAEFARNVHDTSIHTRLKALLDLQALLQSHHNLPPDQLVLVKNQVSELAVKIRAPNVPSYTATPPSTVSPYQPPPAQPVVAVPPVAPTPTPSAAAAAVSIDTLFGTGALAALMGRQQSGTPQASTPQQPPPPAMAIRSPTPQQAEAHKAAAPSPAEALALLNALKQAGKLPPVPAATGSRPPRSSSTPVPPPPIPPPSALSRLLPGLLASLPNATGARPSPLDAARDITLRASSLKQYRPYLLPLIYEDLGPPCSQCGRRFRKDEEGKKKKTAHMDWHFRVHQRIAEAEKRGQHRSWYVDQADWIKSREAVDVDHVDPAEGAKGAGGASSAQQRQEPKAQWIAVPDDGTNTVCPICQEKFEMKWLDEAQEWVWMDAVRVGARAYHASCHAEAARDGGGAHARATPEPVLGKRKAEQDGLAHLRGRIKTDGGY